jgi:hypothetical protein
MQKSRPLLNDLPFYLGYKRPCNARILRVVLNKREIELFLMN